MSSKHETREQYHSSLMQLAREAFENHQISEQIAPHHWLIQRPYRDGHPGFDWTFAAEIVVTRSGNIVVTGDIGPMIFGRYGNPKTNPEGGIHWMGRQSSVTGYVCEKASIGMGNSIAEWNSNIAYTELEELYNNRITEIKEEYGDIENNEDYTKEELEHAIAEVIFCDKELEAYKEAKEYIDDGPEIALQPIYDNIQDWWEIVSDIGRVPKPDVYYTWAALERLSKLLIERDQKECTNE